MSLEQLSITNLQWKSGLIPLSRTISFCVLQSVPISWTPDAQLPADISIWIFLRHHSQQQTPDVLFSCLSSLHNQELDSSRCWRQKRSTAHYLFILCPSLLDEISPCWWFACPYFFKRNPVQPQHFSSLSFFSLDHIYFSSLFPSLLLMPFLSLQYKLHKYRVFICFLQGCICNTQNDFEHEDGLVYVYWIYEWFQVGTPQKTAQRSDQKVEKWGREFHSNLDRN